MAEAETQEEVSDAGAVNVVKLIEDQNSYINSSCLLYTSDAADE